MISLTKYLLLGLLAFGLALGPVFGDGDGGRDGGIVVLPRAMTTQEQQQPTAAPMSAENGLEPRLKARFEPGESIQLVLPPELGDALMAISVGGELCGTGRVYGHQLSISPPVVARLQQVGIRRLTLYLVGKHRELLELQFWFGDQGEVLLDVY